MKKYRCIRDCCIRLGNRKVWRVGMEIELEDDVPIPGHFELVGVERFREPTTEEMTLSGLQKKQKEAVNLNVGFAKTLNEIEPEIKSNKRGK